MEQGSMTALVSAFARGYHASKNDVKIFDDFLAGKILTEEEKQQIALHMSNGIEFFNPAFHGTKEEALRWVVDHQLSPSPLGRAAWAEKALQTAIKIGTTQYLIIAAGYDSFAYRQPAWAAALKIFEFDHPLMSGDKQERVQRIFGKESAHVAYIPIDLTLESFSAKLHSCNTYDQSKLSFCSVLGLSYYLSKDDFKKLIQSIAESVSNGSTLVFDYPDEYAYTDQAGERAKKQSMMTRCTTEAMLASYSYEETNQLLCDCGFLIDEHLTPDEITQQYFGHYNKANPDHRMTAFDNVNYCLAVKKQKSA